MNIPLITYPQDRFPQGIKQYFLDKIESWKQQVINLQLYDNICMVENQLYAELESSGMIYLLDIKYCLPPKELELAIDIREVLTKIQKVKFEVGSKIETRLYQPDRYPQHFARRWYGNATKG